VDDNVKLFANTGYAFGGGTELYGFGNYHTKRVEGGFYFRNPNTRDAVFSIDGGETLLIGDVLDARDDVLDGSANCPVVRIVNNVPDPCGHGARPKRSPTASPSKSCSRAASRRSSAGMRWTPRPWEASGERPLASNGT